MPRLSRTRRRAVLLGAQVGQDVALAALIGGNLFGRTAMHPALAEISDAQERGKVLNRAWRRYGTVNSTALVTLVGGWLVARRAETALPLLGSGRRRLIGAKDVAVGAVVISGLASAAGGVGFAQQAPDGAVPMTDGSQPGEDTPDRAAALKHLTNTLGALSLTAELSLVAVNALLLRSTARYLITG
ncbi:MAG TPA: hypothetical protein VFN55_14140 [Solirubrobacteraceae bacterium]|nr:hypothetical protein [Solirubrobacteraceae bacterium]